MGRKYTYKNRLFSSYLSPSSFYFHLYYFDALSIGIICVGYAYKNAYSSAFLFFSFIFSRSNQKKNITVLDVHCTKHNQYRE